MRLWAALDILDGKVVGLGQGSAEVTKVYSEDPVATARSWIEAGADGLHIVDLNAALGRGHNRDLIRRLSRVGAEVQAGGGVKTRDDLRALFDVGVSRAIVGSLMVREPTVFRELCEAYKGRVVAGIATRDREVRVIGWDEGTTIGLEDAVLRAQAFGAAGAVITDIGRHGNPLGPNVDLIREISDCLPYKFELMVAGGIASSDDLVILDVVGGVAGAVMGHNLYDGEIELTEAVERLAGKRPVFR